MRYSRRFILVISIALLASGILTVVYSSPEVAATSEDLLEPKPDGGDLREKKVKQNRGKTLKKDHLRSLNPGVHSVKLSVADRAGNHDYKIPSVTSFDFSTGPELLGAVAGTIAIIVLVAIAFFLGTCGYYYFNPPRSNNMGNLMIPIFYTQWGMLIGFLVALYFIWGVSIGILLIILLAALVLFFLWVYS